MKIIIGFLFVSFLTMCSSFRLQDEYNRYFENFVLDKNIPNQGAEITSKGKLRVLFIFAMFKDDTLSNNDGWKYSLTSLPDWASKFANKTTEKIFPYNNISHYFYEMSRGNLLIYGDVYPGVVVPDSAESKYKSIAQVNYEILKRIDDEIDFSKYDNWTRTSKGKYIASPDGNVDMIFIIYRNFSNKLFFNQGWTGSAHFYLTKNIKTNDGVTIRTGTLHNGSGIQQRGGKHGFVYTTYIAAHEFAHFLFGGGHIKNASNLSLLNAGPVWNESRGMNSWERIKLGWIKPKDVPLNKNSSFALDDYITTGEALRLKLSENEWYLIENHQKLSPHDWAGDKGIYIFHILRAKKFPPNITVECADGNWNFEIDTEKKKLFKTTPNPNGKNETNFLKRKNGTNYACYEQVYNDNSAWGDEYDAFDLTYNNLFSPVSNPSSKNKVGKSFAVQIKSKRNGKYILNIYIKNIYKNTPPAKPQIFALENITNKEPALVWLPNKEPDLDSYIIEQISPVKKIINKVNKTTTSQILKHLVQNPNLTYLITITAKDVTGKKSLRSNFISIKWNRKENKWKYILLEQN